LLIYWYYELIVLDTIIFYLVFFCVDILYVLLSNSFRQYLYAWGGHCLVEAYNSVGLQITSRGPNTDPWGTLQTMWGLSEVSMNYLNNYFVIFN